MEIGKIHYIGIGAGLAIILTSLLFIGTNFFFLMIGIGILVGALPFVISSINENRVANEKEEMFAIISYLITEYNFN